MYTPINVAIFGAAFAGAYAGMTGTGLASGLANPVVGTYSGITADAYAYAQEVDTIWNNVNNTPVDIQGIQAASIVAFNNRTPHNTVIPGGFLGVASAVVNLVQAGDNTLAGGGTSAGGANRAFQALFTPTTPTIDGTSRIIALATLTASKSGIFRASANVSLLGITPTDTYEIFIGTQQQAPAFVFTNATKVGPGSNGGGVYASDAAGGIGVTGGPFNALTQWISATQTVPTGGNSNDQGWSGLVMNAVSGVVETPFPRGDNVLLSLSLSVSSGGLSLVSCSVSFEEL